MMDSQSSWINMRTLLEEMEVGSKGPGRMKTGFPQLDEILGGGLAPGLVVLGGQPGVGKSTFCLQLAENVAESGIPVLYFSFEMPEQFIAAKAISRKLFQNDCRISAVQLLGGDEKTELDEAQRKLVGQVKASEEFLKVMENFYVWTSPRTVSEMKDMITEFAEKREAENKGKPLVVVDYLQFVPTEKDSKFKSDKEKNDEKVKQFTQLAHEDGFTMLLISSLNRGSYGGDIQISAFKETGEIEYSADVLLGLQFQSFGRRTSPAKEQAKDPREVKISVLKNRYGKSGCMIPFSYYAANDYFREEKFQETEKAELEAAAEQKQLAKAAKKRAAQRCVINNTLVAQELREGKSGQQFCMALTKEEGGKAVELEYTLSEPLSTLDCCVADAIYTVSVRRWADGVPDADAVLSPRELVKALSGDPKPTITVQKMKELYDSIQRLQADHFQMDCWEVLRERKLAGIGPDELRSYDGPFLNLRIEELERGTEAGQTGLPAGREKSVWELGDGKRVRISFQNGVLPLFLHSYGAAVNQMITVPSYLLHVHDGSRHQSNTTEILCLKWALVHRMEIIRYKEKKQENVQTWCRISFRGKGRLLRELQYDRKGGSKAVAEQRERRLHKSVRKVLEYYKQIQYISDYQEMTKTELSKNPTFKVIGPFLDPEDLIP